MFSSTSSNQLSKMKVDIDKYHRDLLKKFDKNVTYFDKLISELHSVTMADKNNFLDFCNEHKISEKDSPDFYNCLYEMFSNLCLYNTGGLWDLFKNKQAEWGTLKVSLSKEDCPEFNKDLLAAETTIYRGMSQSEYDNKDFTQHWTTDINVARNFAFNIYSDEPRGIVVKATIDKEDVLHYDDTLPEKELVPIVEKIKKPIIIER